MLDPDPYMTYGQNLIPDWKMADPDPYLEKGRIRKKKVWIGSVFQKISAPDPYLKDVGSGSVYDMVRT